MQDLTEPGPRRKLGVNYGLAKKFSQSTEAEESKKALLLLLCGYVFSALVTAESCRMIAPRKT